MHRELLKEKKIHGDATFPLKVYEQRIEGSETIVDCHWHDELEFLVVTEGKATFQIETSCYEVCEGQAIFINSGEIHAGYALDSSPCSFCAVVFNQGLLHNNVFDIVKNRYIDPLLKNDYSFNAHLKGAEHWENEVMYHLNEIIDACISNPFTYELNVKARLYLILSNIISNSSIENPVRRRPGDTYKTERLKKVLHYIQTNYNKKITIKDLAKVINMSEGHFCRFFKQMVHKTPIEYINYYRILRASSELELSTKKITQIAMDSGFDNFSYFIKIFKQHMNCTPSEYRRKHISLPLF